MAITDEEKKLLKKEILDEIKALSQGVTDLPQATSLDGVQSLPAMRGMDVVSVPLSMLTEKVVLAQTVGNDPNIAMSQAAVTEALAGKVDAEAGKGLSTCDFTEALRGKLEGLHTGLVAAPAEATLVAQAGKFYYWTNQASLSVTGVQGFTPEADCAALAVSGNCAVTFGSAFKCQQGIDALEATAAQWKIYIIQWVPVSDAGAILVVNCSIYG